jgi:4-hydroxythreonine-4-phosphate dehydrogenase
MGGWCLQMTPLIMTCGDPAGIGPEIAVKASQALGVGAGFVWLGDPAHLPESTRWECVEAPQHAQHVRPGIMPVLYHAFPVQARPGVPDPLNARAVVEVIARAVELVQAGAASGIVTCPINKAALQTGAGFGFPGHTEYLADLAGVDRVVMMLACKALRVVPVTIHIPIKDVPDRLTAALLEETLCITHASLIHDFGIADPKLAVAGLNPHAGESGLMGQEDAEVIAPVLERLQGQGMRLSGPLPADTMFHDAARAKYDAAICMYHDQALIPIKTIDFANGVNVTLGLPFIRTSPDHGTAYDIAGQNKADASSLIAAIRMAQDMADRRQ